MSGCAQPPRQPTRGGWGVGSVSGEDDLSCRAVGDTTSEGMEGCTWGTPHDLWEHTGAEKTRGAPIH